MTISRHWISTVAAFAAVVAVPLTARAAEPADEGFSKTVKMWDLDLAQTDDVQTLYARIRTAAEAVCRSEEGRIWRQTRQHTPLDWNARCVSSAVETAVREVGNRRLASLHQGRPRGVNL